MLMLLLDHDNIKEQKLRSCEILFNDILNDSHNTESIIFSFSSDKLNDDEKYILHKSLNFSTKPTLIEHSDFFTTFWVTFLQWKAR